MIMQNGIAVWKTGWWLLTRLKPRVANDPAIPVLGTIPENGEHMSIQKHVTGIFMVA